MVKVTDNRKLATVQQWHGAAGEDFLRRQRRDREDFLRSVQLLHGAIAELSRAIDAARENADA